MRTKRKKLKWVKTEIASLKNVVNVFKVLPWSNFDTHQQCNFKSLCFLCCFRSFCQRLANPNGPKAVEPSELRSFMDAFDNNIHLHDVLSLTVKRLTENNDAFQKFLSLSLFCKICKAEHRPPSLKLGLSIDPQSVKQNNLHLLAEEEISKFCCPHCHSKGSSLSTSQQLLLIYLQQPVPFSPSPQLISDVKFLPLSCITQSSNGDHFCIFRHESSMYFQKEKGGNTETVEVVEHEQPRVIFSLLINASHTERSLSTVPPYTQKTLYCNSSKGKEKIAAYNSSDIAKKRRLEYQNSEQGKQQAKCYKSSEKAVQKALSYELSDKGREKRLSYEVSERGREKRLSYQLMRKSKQTSGGQNNKDINTTTTTATTTPIDISDVKVKLECDIDIEQLGTNTSIFYDSDEYVPHTNGSVLIRSSDDVGGVCAKPDNVVVKTEPMSDGTSVDDPMVPSTTAGYPSMVMS